MKIEVNVTSVTQSANEVLNTKEKKLFYLLIGEGDTKTLINVGEKTYNNVKKLIDNENSQPPKTKVGK